MGAVYNPFSIQGDPNSQNFSVQDVAPPNGVDMDRVARRRTILDELDTFQRKTDQQQKIVQTMDEFYGPGVQLDYFACCKEGLRSEAGRCQDPAISTDEIVLVNLVCWPADWLSPACDS